MRHEEISLSKAQILQFQFHVVSRYRLVQNFLVSCGLVVWWRIVLSLCAQKAH